MQDAIVGTAVLSELEPGEWWLFICCLSADRKHIDQTAVRAVENGHTHNHGKDRPVWTYEFKGDSRIACKPSVWWKCGENSEDTYFHNTLNWDVDVCCCDTSESPGEIANNINADLRQEWRDKWIERIQ